MKERKCVVLCCALHHGMEERDKVVDRALPAFSFALLCFRCREREREREEAVRGGGHVPGEEGILKAPQWSSFIRSINPSTICAIMLSKPHPSLYLQSFVGPLGSLTGNEVQETSDHTYSHI